MSHKPLVVINIVGLTPSLLGDHTPNLNALATDGFIAGLQDVFPAVTCTAQASMLTGALPTEHGIVGNGWYFRDMAEVKFWHQTNHLMQGEKVWETARRSIPEFSCAQLFWWYNMYSTANWSITPRPIYPADGRKIPALYSSPMGLHAEIEDKIGPFPFFNFWGPRADIRSSAWIAECAKLIFDKHHPTLTLVYLPHLDYNLQRIGPRDERIWDDVRAIDNVAGSLISHLRSSGADIMVLSEYGIEETTGHVEINRILREAGYLSVRETLDWELLDCGASRAFAVADHQVAHIYIKDPHDIKPVADLLSKAPGIARLLQGQEKALRGIDHPRSGELVAIAEPGHWFCYYYWLDDSKAPDFARTVDIHRKPGYDPVELFVDPDLKHPKFRIAMRLAQKSLGFRMLMDVIPLKPALVRGSHGRGADGPDHAPLLISSRRELALDHLQIPEVRNFILRHWLPL